MSDNTDIEDLERVLLEENEALAKALTGLTASGSEFFIRKGERYTADIPACVAWIRQAKEDAYRRAAKAISERNIAEKKIDALMEVLGKIADTPTIEEGLEQFADLDATIDAIVTRAREVRTQFAK